MKPSIEPEQFVNVARRDDGTGTVLNVRRAGGDTLVPVLRDPATQRRVRIGDVVQFVRVNGCLWANAPEKAKATR